MYEDIGHTSQCLWSAFAAMQANYVKQNWIHYSSSRISQHDALNGQTASWPNMPKFYHRIPLGTEYFVVLDPTLISAAI